MIPSRVFIIYDILNMVSTMSRHVRVVVSFSLLLSCAMRFMQYDSMSDFALGAVLISRLLHAHISYIHRAALRVMTMCCAALCHVNEYHRIYSPHLARALMYASFYPPSLLCGFPTIIFRAISDLSDLHVALQHHRKWLDMDRCLPLQRARALHWRHLAKLLSLGARGGYHNIYVR